MFFTLGYQDIELNRLGRYKKIFMLNTVWVFQTCIPWPTLCRLSTTPLLNLPQYNHPTSNLAKYTIKHLKISCQKHKLDRLFLSSRCMTTYMKSCSFIHAHFFELMIVVYGVKLIYWKDICCRYTLELPLVFTSFKHPKLSIIVKIPVTLLQIVYICMTAISPNSRSWTTYLLIIHNIITMTNGQI